MSAIGASPTWKPVVGFEETHEVSSDGRVRSLERVLVDSLGRIRQKSARDLRPTRKSNGYLHVSLQLNKRQRTLHVHRIVLEAFVGSCPEGLEALHRDGDKSNNQLSNLRWGTHIENCADRTRHGTSGHILSLEQAQEIRSFKGVMTQSDIAQRYGVSQVLISKIHRGKLWAINGGAA
ncbi:hypothetical protein HB13667_05985 [Pseudomonas putida]|uniref:HNH nuclease domain-containing protein n=1 Tax=Pseudomonas putida TaxID=303 RepID=A0A0P7DB42_PSEPU|nr:NUMOD4 motif-containing HNH endonuclease [Pseudomonas putida]KPM67592.1 hypothetical protein HB13667_05985 [Pseudomonas putida]